MITIGASISIEGWPAMNRRDYSKVAREALGAIGLEWHDKFLPLHFKRGAKSKYGYRERTAKYNREKRKRHNHTKPLVNTGDMQQELTGAASIRPTRQRVSVNMFARAINLAGRQKRRRPNYPDLRGEVTATTQKEIDRLATRAEEKAARAFARVTKKRRRRI